MRSRLVIGLVASVIGLVVLIVFVLAALLPVGLFFIIGLVVFVMVWKRHLMHHRAVRIGLSLMLAAVLATLGVAATIAIIRALSESNTEGVEALAAMALLFALFPVFLIGLEVFVISLVVLAMTRDESKLADLPAQRKPSLSHAAQRRPTNLDAMEGGKSHAEHGDTPVDHVGHSLP